MVPVSTLYDEYIYRPKLTEQKKKPIWVYSSSPLKRGRNNNNIVISNINIARQNVLENGWKVREKWAEYWLLAEFQQNFEPGNRRKNKDS